MAILESHYLPKIWTKSPSSPSLFVFISLCPCFILNSSGPPAPPRPQWVPAGQNPTDPTGRAILPCAVWSSDRSSQPTGAHRWGSTRPSRIKTWGGWMRGHTPRVTRTPVHAEWSGELNQKNPRSQNQPQRPGSMKQFVWPAAVDTVRKKKQKKVFSPRLAHRTHLKVVQQSHQRRHGVRVGRGSPTGELGRASGWLETAAWKDGLARAERQNWNQILAETFKKVVLYNFM